MIAQHNVKTNTSRTPFPSRVKHISPKNLEFPFHKIINSSFQTNQNPCDLIMTNFGSNDSCQGKWKMCCDQIPHWLISKELHFSKALSRKLRDVECDILYSSFMHDEGHIMLSYRPCQPYDFNMANIAGSDHDHTAKATAMWNGAT